MSELDLVNWVVTNLIVLAGVRVFDSFFLDNSLAYKAPFMSGILKSWVFLTICSCCLFLLNLIWGWFV